MTHPDHPDMPYADDWQNDPATAPQNRPGKQQFNRTRYSRYDLDAYRSKYPEIQPATDTTPRTVGERPRCQNHTPVIAQGVMFCAVCGATAEIKSKP